MFQRLLLQIIRGGSHLFSLQGAKKVTTNKMQTFLMWPSLFSLVLLMLLHKHYSISSVNVFDIFVLFCSTMKTWNVCFFQSLFIGSETFTTKDSVLCICEKSRLRSKMEVHPPPCPLESVLIHTIHFLSLSLPAAASQICVGAKIKYIFKKITQWTLLKDGIVKSSRYLWLQYESRHFLASVSCGKAERIRCERSIFFRLRQPLQHFQRMSLWHLTVWVVSPRYHGIFLPTTLSLHPHLDATCLEVQVAPGSRSSMLQLRVTEEGRRGRCGAVAQTVLSYLLEWWGGAEGCKIEGEGTGEEQMKGRKRRRGLVGGVGALRFSVRRRQQSILLSICLSFSFLTSISVIDNWW